MKSLLIILKKVRNLLPYFFLIATYFFFINLEAKKENNKNQYNEKNLNRLRKETSTSEKQPLRLAIPVIPYKN